MEFRNRALLCMGVVFFAFNAAAQTVGGCPVFPSNNIWNARVDTLPLHARSGAWVTSIGPSATLHQDFGGLQIQGFYAAMPITLVPGTQPKVPINITAAVDESEPGPYPIPPDARVEYGDRHVLVVDTTNCLLYETYDSVKNADNSWTVYSGSIFDLRKNLLRPQGWTSGDAAGLPILAGLPRYEEILAGEIKHALRFTAPRTNREYLWPARHFASSYNDPSLPSMGARFRLKADFDISSFTPTTQIILTALKRYGMMLADNGSSWYIQGSADSRWPDLADEWRRIPGSAFEAVDTSGLMESVDSAAVKGSTITTPTLASAAVSPSSVSGGAPSMLTISLTGSAGAGGVQVSLSSDQGSLSPVPPSVLIPEGSSSAAIPLTTTTVASQTLVTFTATLAGVSRQAVLTVTAPAPTLNSISFPAPAVTGGQGATLRVSLSGQAPAGGINVDLVSGNTGVAPIVAKVLVPAGSASADVAVTTNTVQTQTQVLFTATLAGVQRQATLTVNPLAAPALVSASLGAASVTGGVNTSLTVTLSAVAPAGGVSVALASLNGAVAGVPPSVTVPAGSASVQAAVTTSPVGSVTSVDLTATLAGISRGATLTVNPPAVSAMSVNPGSVTGGSGATCTLTLTGKAPSGGFTASLASSNTSAATVPASMTVAAGQTAANCAVTTKTVTTAATVQLQASALGRSVSANLSVMPTVPTVDLSSVGAALSSNLNSVLVTATLTAPASQKGVVVILNGNNSSVANISNRQLKVSGGTTSNTASYRIDRGATDVTLTITATLGSTVKSTTVIIPKLVVAALDKLDAPSQIQTGRWFLANVTLTGRPNSDAPAPAAARTGVVSEAIWVIPISGGRSTGVLAFRAASPGTGSISVSYGGVTKSVSVTVK